jgi:hypothetical protein
MMAMGGTSSEAVERDLADRHILALDGLCGLRADMNAEASLGVKIAELIEEFKQ